MLGVTIASHWTRSGDELMAIFSNNDKHHPASLWRIWRHLQTSRLPSLLIFYRHSTITRELTSVQFVKMLYGAVSLPTTSDQVYSNLVVRPNSKCFAPLPCYPLSFYLFQFLSQNVSPLMQLESLYDRYKSSTAKRCLPHFQLKSACDASLLF